MKLLLKFNIIFLVVFALGLLAVTYVARSFLEKDARTQVIAQAKLMMEDSLALRSYTSTQIRPLLEARHRKENVFFPQIVPAYAATENFNYLRVKYPDYAYKEATLNPTNLRDRAVDWEADVVNLFRNNTSRTDLVNERETADGRSLFLAQPIRAVQTCLECHSTPDKAPPAMLKLYGSTNGFGWKEGEIIGAQIVSIPMAVPVAMAGRDFKALMISLSMVGLFILAVLNLALLVTVIRPIARMSASAEAISKGNLDVAELPVHGKDEIAVLGDSFNRMHRSLIKAMKLLDSE